MLYLQEFSHKIISRTTEIEQLVDDLSNSTKVFFFFLYFFRNNITKKIVMFERLQKKLESKNNFSISIHFLTIFLSNIVWFYYKFLIKLVAGKNQPCCVKFVLILIFYTFNILHTHFVSNSMLIQWSMNYINYFIFYFFTRDLVSRSITLSMIF